jgi:signal peptidase I
MRILSGLTAGLRRFLDIVLIALIVVVLFGVLLGKVVPLTGRQALIVGGSSMEPAIPLGAAIVVGPVDAADLKVGDVVSLRAGDDRALFTHRITEVVDRPDGRWIRTKGDANDSADPTLVHASAVVGRVQASLPYAGYLLALLSVPMGVLFLLGIAATLLAAVWLLESLELEKIERVTVALDGGDDPALGEPIATRPIASLSLAAETGIAVPVRLTVAEQLAVSRELRRRRNAWQPESGTPAARGRR